MVRWAAGVVVQWGSCCGVGAVIVVLVNGMVLAVCFDVCFAVSFAAPTVLFHAV